MLKSTSENVAFHCDKRRRCNRQDPRPLNRLRTTHAATHARSSLLSLINAPAALLAQLPAEAALALSILVIVAALNWWRPAHLTWQLRKGAIKYLIITLIVIAGFAAAIMTSNDAADSDLVENILSPRNLGLVLLSALLTGVFEEALYRGCLYHGLASKLTRIRALLLSSLMFGVMHYANYFGGRNFVDTTTQVLHAAGLGTMFGALMLRVGSLWPIMALHDLWDALIALIASLGEAVPGSGKTVPDAVSNGSLFASVPSVLPLMSVELLFTLVVFWSWSRIGRPI